MAPLATSNNTSRLPSVLGVTGLAGSGKSTIASYLAEHHGYSRGKFAGAIKAMLRALLEYQGAEDELIDRLIDGDLKEQPCHLLGDKTPRWAMQSLGTEWGRRLMSYDFWVNVELRRHNGNVVFDDVRFENEVEGILKCGGIIIHVTRFETSPLENVHESEAYANTLHADIRIFNNGTIDDLLRKIEYRIIRDEAVPV